MKIVATLVLPHAASATMPSELATRGNTTVAELAFFSAWSAVKKWRPIRTKKGLVRVAHQRRIATESTIMDIAQIADSREPRATLRRAGMLA
jgi:hypothetical protein